VQDNSEAEKTDTCSIKRHNKKMYSETVTKLAKHKLSEHVGSGTDM